MNLKFQRLHEAAQLPTRAKPKDSGMDLCAVEDTILLPGVPTLVQTGLAVELPPQETWEVKRILRHRGERTAPWWIFGVMANVTRIAAFPRTFGEASGTRSSSLRLTGDCSRRGRANRKRPP